MPLIKSSSNEARKENIHREIEAGQPIKKAVAIGYSNQREAQRHTHEEREAPRHEQERNKYGR